MKARVECCSQPTLVDMASSVFPVSTYGTDLRL